MEDRPALRRKKKAIPLITGHLKQIIVPKKYHLFMGNAQSQGSQRDFTKMLAEINEPYLHQFTFNSGIKGYGYRKYVSYNWHGNQVSLAHARQAFWKKSKQGSPQKWNTINKAITQDEQEGLENLKNAGIKMYKGMLMLSQDQEGVKYHLPNFIYGHPQQFVKQEHVPKTNYVPNERPKQSDQPANSLPPSNRQSVYNVIEKQPLLPKQDQASYLRVEEKRQSKEARAQEAQQPPKPQQRLKPPVLKEEKKPEQHSRAPAYHQIKKLQETYKPFVQAQVKQPQHIKPLAQLKKHQDLFKPVVFDDIKKQDQAKSALSSQPKQAQEVKTPIYSQAKSPDHSHLTKKEQQHPIHKVEQKNKQSFNTVKHHEQTPKYVPPVYTETASNSVFIVKSSNNLGEFKSSKLAGSMTSLPEPQFSFVSKEREKAEEEINNIIKKQNVNIRGQQKNCLFCF